jgi:hypothetical protein
MYDPIPLSLLHDLCRKNNSTECLRFADDNITVTAINVHARPGNLGNIFTILRGEGASPMYRRDNIGFYIAINPKRIDCTA